MRGIFRSVLSRHVVRRSREPLMLVALALCVSILPAASAWAHQSPGSCNSNRLTTSIIKDKTQVFQGDTITYSATVSNANFGGDIACDITNATVQLTLPAMDGTPTGTVVTLASGVDYLGGTPVTFVGSAPYLVNVNPGVNDIVAQVSANGILHDAPVDHSALIIKTLGTTVVTLTTPPPTTPPSASEGGSTSSAKIA